MCIAVLAAKPVPEIDTEVPAGPCAGLGFEIAGVTVNVAVAALWLVVLSVAVTVWLPAVACGTVKVVENAPLALVVVAGMVIEVESKVMVIPEFALKPAPVTVTDCPTGPLVGLS
jgi:hypothetical protein